MKIEESKIAKGWEELISWFFATEDGKSLQKFINSLEEKECCPRKEHIFRAFSFFPMDQTKVVILGQDPYYTKYTANGLAFAMDTEDGHVPPSLRNILKEATRDIYDMSGGKDIITATLLPWAAQGVLLLNTALTTKVGKAGAHLKEWQNFTNCILTALGKGEDRVFMLWGQDAQAFEGLINHQNNLVLKTSHPSPLSVNKGFAGCGHFSTANNFLKEKKKQPIVW